MIDVHCPDCGRVLLASRQILALSNGDDGIRVTYVCWCGRPGAELVGRARNRRHPAAIPAGNEGRRVGVRR